jgi:hypothetical protein
LIDEVQRIGIVHSHPILGGLHPLRTGLGFRYTQQIPLPARCLIDDDFETQTRDYVEAMENLAEALIRFADQTRKRWPHDWD